MEVKKVKPVLNPKNSQVKDPPRYPKVINGYELLAKRNYTSTLQVMVNDLAKEMVKK